MDIIHLIQTAPLVDLILVFGLFAAFIIGVMQGAVRRIIGILSMLVAFVLAADLREPVGDYLSDHWTQFPPAYDHLLAFAILFCIFTIGAAMATQTFYKRVDLYGKRPVVDDLIGGALGVVQGILLLMIALTIFSSYSIPQEDLGGASDYMRQLHEYMREAQEMLIHQSWLAGFIRDHAMPAFVTALSPVLPSDIVSLFR